MASYNVAPLEELVDQFARLPGIGKKTAQRLSFFVLGLPEGEAEKFADAIAEIALYCIAHGVNVIIEKPMAMSMADADAIVEAHKKIHSCKICQNLTDGEICSVCASGTRDRETICVVEDPRDVMAFERTGDYNGLYHVLHGVISPMDGVGPDGIRIKELLARLNNDEVKEVIMATNPTVEGEATAMYISKLLNPLGIKISRLAYGIPVGGDLQYADEVTLSRALKGRNQI